MIPRPIPPRSARRWRSNRPMRWPWSRRRPSTTGSIPAPRASDTRWWSTSMHSALADAEQPGQSVLEDGARVPAETSQRLACDASRVVMRHDEDGAHRGGRGPDAHDSTGIAPRAPPPRPGLPLPGLPAAVRAGPSPPSLGAGGPDHAVEPRIAVSPPSPRGARGRLSGRSTVRWRASVLATGRQAAPRRPGARRGACRSGPGAPRTARRAGAPPASRGRRARHGWASAWIWVTRSTSCIRWPTDSRDRHGARAAPPSTG